MTSKIKLATEAFKHKGFIQRLPVIMRMIKSSFRKGGYKPEIKSVIVPGAILLYLLSPLDFIPDWIPVVGAMDDIALIAFAIPILMKEAERFVAWEAKHKNITTIEVEEVK